MLALFISRSQKRASVTACRCLKDRMTSLRTFSSTAGVSTSTPTPLFLWLGSNVNGEVESSTKNNLLLPVKQSAEPSIFSPEDVVTSVNQYYDSDSQTQFVGGMGEDDPGVWFSTILGDENDTLHYSDIIQEGISLVKQERHGIPFGLYTTGILDDDIPPLSELGLSSLQVSLFAGSPKDYSQITGRDERSFGQLCGFIVDATEQGIAVEVGIEESYADGAARDLALSLGAQQVHVFSTSI